MLKIGRDELSLNDGLGGEADEGGAGNGAGNGNGIAVEALKGAICALTAEEREAEAAEEEKAAKAALLAQQIASGRAHKPLEVNGWTYDNEKYAWTKFLGANQVGD